MDARSVLLCWRAGPNTVCICGMLENIAKHSQHISLTEGELAVIGLTKKDGDVVA